MTTSNYAGETISMTATAVKKDTAFARDVIEGLTSRSKYLSPKYLYDSTGDHIFQQIMQCEEYYPFDCELEIFKERAQHLAELITTDERPFDLIELGAGDCTKSSYLLRHLVERGTDFTYMPIDISSNIIHYLNRELPSSIPGIKMLGLNGEYFEMLERASFLSGNRKVVMFLGCNLGNMFPEEAFTFCRDLRSFMRPGDMAIIGLDLKKEPATILAAYNDRAGISLQFNLNLLRRINRELRGTFDTRQFKHFPIYDPGTGSCKSYLISLRKQDVTIFTAEGPKIIHFNENEEIFMEISQKYTIEQIGIMAKQAAFEPVEMIFDHKKWFVDTIWKVI